MVHPLVNELQKLSETSKHAVAQGGSYDLDEFREYIHIEREVEIKLKEQIKHCASEKSAQLLMVCGNVGDGKSHILSYLNNELSKELKEFKIHNDATEAHNPKERSNETLFKLLESFQDNKISDSDQKIILAINLGTLNNFLDEFGDQFKSLTQYVEDKKILDTGLLEDEFTKSSGHFQHVNFADYHMYTLTGNGPKSLIISSLLNRIVEDHPQNTIYKGYIKSLELFDGLNCPIIKNFEFLFNENHRETVSDLLIQTIVKEKEIIPLRALLNFFYDLIVPIGLPWDNIDTYKNIIKNLNGKSSFDMLIPNYIFEHGGLSGIFNKLSFLDPCQRRYFELDQEIIHLVNSETPEMIFKRFVGDDCDPRILKLIQKGIVNTNELPKLLIRMNYFANRDKAQELSDPYYKDFMKALYAYNKFDKQNTQRIYKLVMDSSRKWFGDSKQSKKVVLEAGQKQSSYRVFKEFHLKPDIRLNSEIDEDKIVKFVQEITLFFEVKNESMSERIDLDFGLFKILNQVKNGYLPNKKDNGNYLSFLKSIRKLINKDDQNVTLEIDKINYGEFTDFKLEKDEFDNYIFRKSW